MNKNTSRILIYAVIFLAVLNVATFISIGINIRNSNKELPQASSVEIKTAQNFNGRYFRDQLQLSPKQMDQFRVINDQFRFNARRINNELIILRAKMMDEMKQASADTVKLSLQSDSIGILHADLKKFTYEYYMGIKGICFEKQIPELDNIFEQFFKSSEHYHGRGQGNQRQGKGQGRGFGRRKFEQNKN
jgi:hypothetical protein